MNFLNTFRSYFTDYLIVARVVKDVAEKEEEFVRGAGKGLKG